MSKVAEYLIVDSLQELGSEELQRMRWLSDGSTEVSSLSEAVEELYTDSGLAHTLERDETVFSKELDDNLRELRGFLKKIDSNRAPELIIADPMMAAVRDHSNRIIALLGLR